VKINYDECIGCEACVQACPFGAIIALEDKVVKCELCGGSPQCVRYCAAETIKYMDASEASRKQREKGAEKPLRKRMEIFKSSTE
jgi:Fe-S-cluster-containing hydrogenase component 2